jgi:drug/metabolite transporter (DMT)-like permease
VFVHPYLQTAFMFLGELFCFTFLAAKIWYDKKYGGPEQTHDPTKEKPRTNINPLLMAIPASCDVMGSTLMFVALTMVPASVYQMMRGLIVVITALMSIIFLGKKQYRHHWTGVALILVGVFLVGYVSVAGGESSGNGGQEIVGILLLIIA